LKNKKFNRRNFLSKIVGITALGGIASLILGNKVEKVSGYDIQGEISNKQIAYGDTTLNTIAGSNNLKWDDANRNFVGGNWSNLAQTSKPSVITGATISGGGGPSPNGNKVTDSYGTVGGGYNNRAGDNNTIALDAAFATVGGGESNTASGNQSTVSGGSTNTASLTGSTVGGGYINYASGAYSTIGGGAGNIASENRSTIGGGETNTASGICSTVPGGYTNTAAGHYSFAAGKRANANHDGAFLFADSTDEYFNSANADEFAVRCTNGARFVAGSSNPGMKVENTGSGTALHVEGKSFFKSAGTGTFSIGQNEKIITVPSGITIGDNSAILVTLNDDSSNIFVLWAKKETDNSFRIRLSGEARDLLRFGYLIIDGETEPQ
jgi:hypothetical protein